MAEKKPNVTIIGIITVVDEHENRSTVQKAMLVEFESAEQLRRAIGSGHVDFDFLRGDAE